MSLQGTLRTLGITEVLEFLADRSATGRLDITADSGSATYWMLRGEVADVDYDFERESGIDAAESTYYALSELDGTFFFDEGEAPEHGTPTESVADVLARTADIAEGWSIVEEQIPSPQHELLRSDALDGSVTIEPAWWRAIEAIGSGSSSRSLADALQMRALAASTMAADMARVGLITVGEPVNDELPVADVVAADDMNEAFHAEEPAAPMMEQTIDESVAISAPIEEMVPEAPTEMFAPVEEATVPMHDAFAEDLTSAADAGDWAVEPAPVEAPVVEPAVAETATATWDTPAPTDAPAWDQPAPAPETPVAAAPTWDTPAPMEPAAETGWDTPAEPAVAAAPTADDMAWGVEPAAPAVASAAPAVEDDDDGWASDHSQPGATNQFPETNDAAAALASWGAVAAAAPAPAPAPAAPAAVAPAPEPVAAAPAAPDPFADLPSEADLSTPPAPQPAPVMETAPAADPSYQAPPTQAAVFAAAPPAPSPYAPDHAPVAPAPIAPPAGSIEELASLEELDDIEDEDFGTDDRSSVLKFLRRD